MLSAGPVSSSLPAIVLGAVLALAAQAVVQLIVVPYVDARRRRRGRWEEDVVALGEILTGDVVRKTYKARLATYVFQSLSHDLRHLDDAEEELVKKHLHDLGREASDRLSELDDVARTRVGWLLRRVVSLAPNSSVLLRAAHHGRLFDQQVMFMSLWDYFHGKFDEEKFDSQWKEVEARRSELTELVLTLAERRRAPLGGPIVTVGRWAGRQLSGMGRWVVHRSSAIRGQGTKDDGVAPPGAEDGAPAPPAGDGGGAPPGAP